MKRLKLILIGLTPLLIGYLFNLAVVRLDGLAPRAWLVALFFLTGWIILGYISGLWAGQPLTSTFWAHLPGGIALLLIAYQQLVQGEMWGNAIGRASQYFFLPLISLANFLPLTWLQRTFLLAALISFILMVLGFLWGARSRQRYKN